MNVIKNDIWEIQFDSMLSVEFQVPANDLLITMESIPFEHVWDVDWAYGIIFWI